MGLDMAMPLGIPQTALKVPGSADLLPWNILVRARFGKQTHQDCHIRCQGDERSLLSWYNSIALGILPIDFTVQIQPVMETQKSSTPPVVLPRWPHTHTHKHTHTHTYIYIQWCLAL